jgi:TPR repeat protein
MNDTSSLNAAKKMLQEKRFQEAISNFERISKSASKDAPEAAYCLGMINQIGSGVPANIEEAKKHYLIAERSGYAMATYRLAVIYRDNGEPEKAYRSFQAIAHDNPSAAYWAHWLLQNNNRLDDDPHASERYLNSAAEQGHVLALRIIAMRFVSGNKGITKIPYGLKLFLKMSLNTRRVVNRNEKLKYS